MTNRTFIASLALAAILGLAFGGTLFFSVWGEPNRETGRHTEQANRPKTTETLRTEQDKPHHEQSEFWPPILGYQVKVSDSLLVAFTGLLFVATMLLWSATNRLVREAKDTAEQELRAYVFLKNLYAVSVSDSTGQVVAWQFHAIWRNSGKTPTKFLFARKNVMAFPGGMPRDFDYADLGVGPTTKSFIGSEAEIDAGGLVVPMAILSQVAAANTKLYYWGWAEYSDVFKAGRRYRSEFCSEVSIAGPLNRPSGGPQREPFNFIVYGPHNGTDDECLRRPTTRATMGAKY